MSSLLRKMQRQIQKNNGTLTHKKVVAKKMGITVSEYNRRMAVKERNLKEAEESNNGTE